MDITFFTDMLKNLDTKTQTIHNTVHYCWANKSSCNDIVKMIQRQYNQAKREKKIAFFYLINLILQNSASTGQINFIKAIGGKIKNMISDFVKGNQNLNDISSLAKLIEMWHGDQIFSINFTTKLRDIVNPIYKRLQDNQEQQKPQKQSMKYNRTFLVDYMAIQEFEPTKNQYENYIAWTDISSKVNKFNQEYNKLDLVNPTEEIKARSEELVRIGEEYKNQLLKVIQGIHMHYKILSDRCKDQIGIKDSHINNSMQVEQPQQ